MVIATGATPRPLGVPGEETLVGKGVHYCAACDGAPYRGRTVAVVGGGNSAAADALTLSRIAKKVYLIHRRDSLRATKVYHEPLINAPNVEFCWNSTVSALVTGCFWRGVTHRPRRRGGRGGGAVRVVRGGPAPGGALSGRRGGGRPLRWWRRTPPPTNLTGAGPPGVFAAGDVRTKVLRQVVTAVSDGAVAVHFAERYLAEKP